MLSLKSVNDNNLIDKRDLKALKIRFRRRSEGGKNKQSSCMLVEIMYTG